MWILIFIYVSSNAGNQWPTSAGTAEFTSKDTCVAAADLMRQQRSDNGRFNVLACAKK
jgi:hypothetical protein